jgi:hypothetical protein
VSENLAAVRRMFKGSEDVLKAVLEQLGVARDELVTQHALFGAATPVLLAAGKLVDTSWRQAPNEDAEPEAHAAYVELALAVREWREALRAAAPAEPEP